MATCNQHHHEVWNVPECSVCKREWRIEELEQKLQEREAYWQEWNGRASVRNEGLEDTLEKANRLATQRGARMQMLKTWIDMNKKWESFLIHMPEAADWFDADGVPVRKAREGKVMDTNKEDEKAKRLGLAVACRGGRYFVVVASTGLEHCGPYSSFFDAWDWIQQIQEEGK